jgi:O-antigen ligase
MYSKYGGHLAALMLLAYPTLMLTVHGGMNGIFILALMVALLAWSFGKKNKDDNFFGRRDLTIYIQAMFGLTIATFISQSYWQLYASHDYDAISRYWLSIPILFWMSRLEPKVFHALQYGFPLAAIIGFLLTENIWGRLGVSTVDLIHFGDSELLLAFLSLYCINWFRRDPLGVLLLKLAGFVAGVAASFASGSRGGWLAIPVFIVIFVYFYRQRLPLRTIAGLIIATVSSMALLYAFNGTINQRVTALGNDIRYYQAGNRETSIGLRWQLYTAAIDIISRHPVVGVGPVGFAREMQPMMEAGKLSTEAANVGRGEVHNDVLSKTAGMGMFGLVAILALYLVPFRLFWVAAKSTIREVRRTGILGITFISGILVFGLTVEFLNLTYAAAFYAFTVAVLLAGCNSLYRMGRSIPLS